MAPTLTSLLTRGGSCVDHLGAGSSALPSPYARAGPFYGLRRPSQRAAASRLAGRRQGKDPDPTADARATKASGNEGDTVAPSPFTGY